MQNNINDYRDTDEIKTRLKRSSFGKNGEIYDNDYSSPAFVSREDSENFDRAKMVV